jgi:hypothetical protein
MGRPAGWMKALTGRSSMKSPGAPSLRREIERKFWREIAKGLLAEEAAATVGVSPAARGCPVWGVSYRLRAMLWSRAMPSMAW